MATASPNIYSAAGLIGELSSDTTNSRLQALLDGGLGNNLLSFLESQLLGDQRLLSVLLRVESTSWRLDIPSCSSPALGLGFLTVVLVTHDFKR